MKNVSKTPPQKTIEIFVVSKPICDDTLFFNNHYVLKPTLVSNIQTLAITILNSKTSIPAVVDSRSNEAKTSDFNIGSCRPTYDILSACL